MKQATLPRRGDGNAKTHRRRRKRRRELDFDALRRTVVGVVVLALVALSTFAVVIIATGRHIPEPPKPPAPDPVDLFPVDEARAVAATVVADYLGVNRDEQHEREQRLAAHVADGVDISLGWSGDGYLDVLNVTAGAVDVDSGARTAAVTVAATVAYDDALDTRWLQVPVAVDDQGVAVIGAPAPVSAPARAEAPEPHGMPHDHELAADLHPTLFVPFFEAWAEGDEAVLSALTVDGANLRGLGGYELQALGERAVTVEDSDGPVRRVSATVTLVDPAGIEFTYAYRLAIEQVSDSRWLIRPPVEVDRPDTGR